MNLELLHAYRTLMCFKNKDITNKDCSNLDFDKAQDIVLNFVKQYLDNQETIDTFRRNWKENK